MGILGCLGLAGWFFGFAEATAAGLGVATMKFNTALCMIASAGVLALLAGEEPAGGRLGSVLAGIVLVTGLATLAEYVTGTDLGIDQLLFTDSQTPSDMAPGRMSAVTAFDFVLFAIAALVSRRKSDAVANAGFTVGAMAGLIVSLVALAGYLYETPVLYQPVPAASIAFTTALSFALLFAGLMATRPDLGIVAILVSPGAGGAFARRVLPPLALVPPVLGWLLLRGHAAGLYDTALAVALFAVVGMLILGAATWAGGWRANRLDAERRAAFEALSQSERLLTESEDRYRSMVELIDIGICIQTDGALTYANPAMARLVGRAGDLVGREIFPRVHPDDRMQAAAFLDAAQKGESKAGPTEFRLFGADGTTIRVELQPIGFQREGRRHLICICRDVTAQREAEAQLRHAQKMQAVGELTGGVAHDFNNLLTVVMGNLELALPQLSGPERQAIESAMSGAERGAALTHRLLAFSRQQPLAPERLEMNELTAGVRDLMQRTLDAAIEIEVRPNPEPVIAFADRHQVENVLLNLAINARDAMPNGGKLTIETGPSYLDEAYAARNAEVTPGPYVMVAVTDTGTGMPPEVIERAFDPFYTTKAPGQGTGLGLSMAYGFVKQSQGHLKIYSKVGRGTTIRMHLPAVEPGEPDAEVIPRAPEPVGAIPRGGETILVVEDDTEIRALVVMDLRRLGYRVLEAENGPIALKILEAAGSVDLLFTDIIMPGGMTGRELSDAVKEMNPKVMTLFTSGYTQSTIIRQGRLDDGIHFLPKPYRLKELSEKIREVLD